LLRQKYSHLSFSWYRLLLCYLSSVCRPKFHYLSNMLLLKHILCKVTLRRISHACMSTFYVFYSLAFESRLKSMSL